jgi:hypothetical protein
VSESSTPTAQDVAREIAIRLRQTGKRFCVDIDSECCIQCREVLVIYAEEITAKLSPHFAELAKLQKFKDYVHKRLDDAGIPTHPDGPHAAEGCRVGERFDVLFAELAALRRERDERWISVDERLPDIGMPVWIMLESGRMIVGGRGVNGDEWHWCRCYGDFYYDKGWKTRRLEMDDDYKVTRWRPLPMALAAAQKGVTR